MICSLAMSEHQGVSYRTKQMLAKLQQSAVRDHFEVTCGKRPNTNKFSILYKGKPVYIMKFSSLMGNL